MRVGLGYFLALSAILFSLGVYGAVSKRGMVMVLMSLELIAMSVNLNLVAFARFVTPNLMTGQYFAGSKPVPSSKASYDEDTARRLWEVSSQMTGLEAAI